MRRTFSDDSLMRDELRLVGQLGEHLRRDVDAVGDRVVVDHDRQVGGRRRRRGSGPSSRARRTCRPSPAAPSGRRRRASAASAAKRQAIARRVLGDAGQHRHAAADVLDRRLEHVELLGGTPASSSRRRCRPDEPFIKRGPLDSLRRWWTTRIRNAQDCGREQRRFAFGERAMVAG